MELPDPGVVDQDLAAIEACGDGPHRVRIGDVAGIADTTDGDGRLDRPVAVEIERHHPVTIGGQPLRRRTAEALPRSGDHCDAHVRRAP